MTTLITSSVLLNILLIACVHGNRPLASTTKGQVEGITKVIDGSDVNLFLGIPYAKPPLAERRFKPPELPDSWSGVLNATAIKAGCPQKEEWVPMALGPGFRVEEISEDCLYLNVYSPAAQDSNSDKLAVVVFFHGGGFQMGSGTLFDYSTFAKYANVVVVSMNYRIGVLGFLSTEDSAAPGNWGLLDQRLALQWTQDNVENFGGDKTQVTIFGHASGAYSVGLHILSPMSRGLFKRAISEAGTIKAPALLNTNPLRRVKPLAMMAQCLPRGAAFDSQKVVDCLRKTPYSELLKHDAHTSGKFTASVDGNFLPDDPVKLLVSGKFNPVDYIIGCNSDEGSSVAKAIPNFYTGPGLNITDYEKYIIKASTYAVNNPTPKSAESAIRAVLSAKYFPRDATNQNFRRAYLDALGEVMTSMVFKHAHFHSMKGRAYVYYFTHKPSNARFPAYVGPGHTEELQFNFGNILENGTDDEKSLSINMMQTWGNFVRTGNPKFNNDSVDWPVCKPPHLNYLEVTVNMNETSVKAKWKNDVRKFWNLAVPAVVKLAATSPPVTSQKCKNLNWGMDPEEADAVFIVLITVSCFLLVIMGGLVYIQLKSNKRHVDVIKHRHAQAVRKAEDVDLTKL